MVLLLFFSTTSRDREVFMSSIFPKALILICLAVSAFAGKETNRGNLWDFDAGAPKKSKWPKLFGDTPNYRAYGQTVLGGRGEKFRWKMGPMWYRGRLEQNQVKVFIVGQEGAQDENVSNRSFTGSTGTRMQKFLNYLGIDRSYLFMNTFVYTITGQYSLFGEDRKNFDKVLKREKLIWLAQDKDSIVVQHRHDLFNYMLETNKDSLAVVIGVGTAGKDSVATWFQSHGAQCTSRQLSSNICEGAGKLEGVIGIAVRHPGSASPRNGGKDAKGGLVADFQKKANLVAKAIQDQKIEMSVDPEMTRDFSENFKYGYASIPHRDFAFGTNWQMGRWATTSNRRGSEAIQVFSQQGCYNNLQYRKENELIKHLDRDLSEKEQKAIDLFMDYQFEKAKKRKPELVREDFLNDFPRRFGNRCMGNFPEIKGLSRKDARRVSKVLLKQLKYDEPEDLLGKAPKEMRKGDLPFESPKNWRDRKKYDYGPSKEFAELMINFFDLEYPELGVTQDMDFGPNGIYRGTLKGSRLLVIADQNSHTDMFSGRALTGEAGQRLQGLFKALDLERKYTILRTLPVDTLDLSFEKRVEIAKNPEVMEKRIELIRAIMKKNRSLRHIVFIGPVADKIKVEVVQQTADLRRKIKISRLPIPVWETEGEKAEILEAYNDEIPRIYKYANKYKLRKGERPGLFSGDLKIIPRRDLPMHTRWWMGTSGDRATRAFEIINGKKVYNGSYYKFLAPNWAEKWKVSEEDLNKSEKDSAAKIKIVEEALTQKANDLVAKEKEKKN